MSVFSILFQCRYYRMPLLEEFRNRIPILFLVALMVALMKKVSAFLMPKNTNFK